MYQVESLFEKRGNKHIVKGHNVVIYISELAPNDVEGLHQIMDMADHPAFKNQKIRIMADFHLGKGSVIGFTSTLGNSLIPNVVGVDIGCGVMAYPLGVAAKGIDFECLDKHIRQRVPLGFHHRKCDYDFKNYLMEKEGLSLHLSRMKKVNWMWFDVPGVPKDIIEHTWAKKQAESVVGKVKFGIPSEQLGTLGGGNHFIEIGESQESKEAWLLVHTGSRNFGLQVANLFQNLAVEFCKTSSINVPRYSEYLPMQFGGDTYLKYMNLAQDFASFNRRVITSFILDFFGINYDDNAGVESVHNYIDITTDLIRKGAVSTTQENVVVPLNMSWGSIIGTPKNGEEQFNRNWSVPHGAGRTKSRKEAHKTNSMDKFKESMEGVYSTSVCESTLDESAESYKRPELILEQLNETLDIYATLKSVYNLKDDTVRKKWRK